MPEELVEYITVRCPTDVNEKIKVLASLKGISVQEWSNTKLREFVAREYAREMAREARKHVDLGNPVG